MWCRGPSTQAQAEAIVSLRRQHPSWGPKKLRAKLLRRAPEQHWPALSTIGDLLQRAGLSQRRKRRRRVTPMLGAVPPIVAPNEVWCVDFKGWFRTGDGATCYPLTVTDAFSRYLLAAVRSRPTMQAAALPSSGSFVSTACRKCCCPIMVRPVRLAGRRRPQSAVGVVDQVGHHAGAHPARQTPTERMA
jgi:transposase InsO family protein